MELSGLKANALYDTHGYKGIMMLLLWKKVYSRYQRVNENSL